MYFSIFNMCNKMLNCYSFTSVTCTLTPTLFSLSTGTVHDALKTERENKITWLSLEQNVDSDQTENEKNISSLVTRFFLFVSHLP